MSVLLGDCRQTLRTLEPDSVQTCVTSPPYWGLRDYGTATWEGGAEDCDHRKVSHETAQRAIATSTLGGSKANTGNQLTGFGSTCRHCGARRIDSQLGLEETPDAYVANMVAVFREVRRVLKPDGTLWLNLGDSYAGSWGNQGRTEERGTQRPINAPMMQEVSDGRYPERGSKTGSLERTPGLKPKDLCGIPWKVAFALQADGWWLRSDIIWSKPSPMPESVTDRPTKAHEYVFLLSKSATYFYDAKAIAEPALTAGDIGGFTSHQAIGANVKPTGNQIPERGRAYVRKDIRNARSVWSIVSEPYDGAHFAVMPSALAARCILAGSRMGDTVLDPFLGSGTVGMVAEELGRKWVGCELNPEFAKLIAKRTAQRGLFTALGPGAGEAA